MKAEKLPSGNYRVKRWNGKNAAKKWDSITVKSKEEADRIIHLLELDAAAMTVEEACEGFLTMRRQELSPSTVRGYESTMRLIKSDKLGAVKLLKLTTAHLQRWVNEMTCARKTKKNHLGFVIAALRFFEIEKVFRVRIAQAEEKQMYTPTVAEVNRVMDIADDELHLAICLGCLGLRRGEICALNAEDIDRDRMVLKITKAVVRTPEGGYAIKAPKTKKSKREVKFSEELLPLFPEEGRLIKSSPDAITLRFIKAVKKAGVPHFRFHDLRSFSASVALSPEVGASRMTVRDSHGWETDRMLEQHYERSMRDQKEKDEAKIIQFYSTHLHIKKNG